MGGKRAYQAEANAKKINSYAEKIRGFIARLREDPWHYDYSEALEILKRENPRDLGLIAQAERDVYGAFKGK